MSKAPPIPKRVPTETTIITKKEMNEADSALGLDCDKIQMRKETQGIYSDYLGQLENGGEVKILTVEERKAAALQRAEENKQKFLQMVKQQKLQFKKDMKQALAEKEKVAARRKRKRR